MLAPKLEKKKVGICHYLLFTNPNRLLDSHRQLCGETYASMVREHLAKTDVKYDKKGTFKVASKNHETEKCLFSKLKECTEEVPTMPCWIKPKNIPAKYKSPKGETEIFATKFMREKLEYREKVELQLCLIFRSPVFQVQNVSTLFRIPMVPSVAPEQQ